MVASKLRSHLCGDLVLRLRVKEEAQARGFTIARLERAAAVDIKTVRAIWHNPQHHASFKTLEKIARALGCSTIELLEDSQ
jgi:transcriptional regulator with XRE-family HTH domain